MTWKILKIIKMVSGVLQLIFGLMIVLSFPFAPYFALMLTKRIAKGKTFYIDRNPRKLTFEIKKSNVEISRKEGLEFPAQRKIRQRWTRLVIFWWMVLGVFFSSRLFDLGEVGHVIDLFHNGVAFTTGLFGGILIGSLLAQAFGRAVSVFVATSTFFWSGFISLFPAELDYHRIDAMAHARDEAAICLVFLVAHVAVGLALKARGRSALAEAKATVDR